MDNYCKVHDCWFNSEGGCFNCLQEANKLKVTKTSVYMTVEGGIKYDDGKAPLNLLATDWLIEVAKVLEKGAGKYGKHNWRNGMEFSRLIAASLRHLLAFNKGEDLDPEFKLSHLAHATCCL